MFLRAAAPLRNWTLDIHADFVCVMLKGKVPHELCSLIASASLVGIPKPAGGIRPIAIGLTLRRLAGKVALYLVSEETTAYLQPQQLGVGVPSGAKATAMSPTTPHPGTTYWPKSTLAMHLIALVALPSSGRLS